ncbi:hypothetical protein KAW55_02385 [bacterium]|nr:hypothetical protein [bacterium]
MSMVKTETYLKETIFLIIIFGLSFWLRSFHVNRVFVSSDDVIFRLFALNLYHRSLFSLKVSENLIAGILSSNYGHLQTLIFIYIWFLSILHITINEFALMLLPVSLVSFIPVGSYLLVKRLHGPYAARLSSLMMAVLPFAVFRANNSWTIGSVGPFSFAIFGLYFIVVYFETKRQSFGWLASLFLTIFLSISVMFSGIIPVIIFASYIYNTRDKHGWREKIKATIIPLRRKEILLLPVLTFIPFIIAYLYSLFVLRRPELTCLGHYMSQKKVLSFYLSNMIFYYKHNLGVEYSLFALLGIGYGIIQTLKGSKVSILFIWALMFGLPFLFLVPDYAGWPYLVDSQNCILLLSMMGIYAIISYVRKGGFLHGARAITVGLVIFLCASFLYTLGHLTGHRVLKSILSGPQPIFQLHQVDIGIKAAGLFVRENYGQQKDMKIFTDAEPGISQYYFGLNKIFCQYDADLEANLAYFEEVKNGMDLVVLDSYDAEKYIPAGDISKHIFYKIAEITRAQRPVRVIYGREKITEKIIETEEANSEFDRRYGKVKKLVPQKIDYPAKNRPLL